MASTSSLEAINTLYREYSQNYQYLMDSGQISFATDYKSQYSKIMLLSAASYFESKVIRIVTGFLNSDNCPVRAGFLEKKALKRQYHTLFNWDQTNANQFFGLFGDDFKEYVKSKVEDDNDLKSAIKDFMELGSYRNKLVHDNYATFNLPLTAEEVKTKFDNADIFVSNIENLVTEFKTSA
ncbi:HEPN domain-containing protein [Vibrio parahaemolyticus]|uniref:HEPN domain-containing protein n=1 Tax=Vibrio parahaemolyticus TaxID=670 RepID=UPI0009B6FE76|nr:HEPN domain-containing protein [Vibrio parahaemolyticus]OQK30610.1 hypothetical protein XE88_c11469 [Vibrio parahaemolyticus]